MVLASVELPRPVYKADAGTIKPISYSDPLALKLAASNLSNFFV